MIELKYIILIGLCAYLGYEIYVLVKTIIAKRKANKVSSVTLDVSVDNNDIDVKN